MLSLSVLLTFRFKLVAGGNHLFFFLLNEGFAPNMPSFQCIVGKKINLLGGNPCMVDGLISTYSLSYIYSLVVGLVVILLVKFNECYR